ncbi:MAG: hypothetical protein ACNI26_13165 [Terasakiella sp.]|uniref:hypothetical protein n=1 Tax=unclassified Terasakiella TaxID=2614952 RepID=UPI003B00A127
MGKNKVTYLDAVKMKSLREQGLTLAAIAQQFGVSTQTVNLKVKMLKEQGQRTTTERLERSKAKLHLLDEARRKRIFKLQRGLP